MFWNKYPYTDFHELNLDMILRLMKELHSEWNEFTALNKITNAGAWDITKQYQAWTIVSDNNAGYISLKPVPAGVSINNIEYWGLVADYDILITDLSNRISALENYKADTEHFVTPEMFGAVGDGIVDDHDAIQDAIDYVKDTDGYGSVHFKSKSYRVNAALTVDVNKVSLYGDNTRIDMTASTGGVILYNSGYDPYHNCDKIIFGIHFDGHSSIDCFTTQANNIYNAVSHVKIFNCNIEHFRCGFVVSDYTYLITLLCTDIFRCTTCLKVVTATDSGENISLVDCTLYNSDTAIYNENPNASIFINNTSIDYNNMIINGANHCTNIFTGCHIEGAQKIKGYADFYDCTITFTSGSSWFDVSNNAVQNYSDCVIHAIPDHVSATHGNGHIYFNRIHGANVSNLITCDFNGLASSVPVKPINIFGRGTADGTNPWNSTNCTISMDTGTYSTGNFSYKAVKSASGSGSRCQVCLIIPRTPTAQHAKISIKFKFNAPLNGNITASLYTINTGILSSENGVVLMPVDASNVYTKSYSSGTDFTSWYTEVYDINTDMNTLDNSYYFIYNLNDCGINTTIWIDSIDVVEM